tara:strand:+ start:11744 stop:12250 length:507 start_codon:yes stop_codon:yes gene_type:complete
MGTFVEVQRMDQWWIKLIIYTLWGFLVFSCYQWFINKVPVGNVPETAIFGQLFTVIAVLLTSLLLLFIKLTVRIDREGIHYQFFPFHLKFRTVAWNSIERCTVRQYNPIMEYGGWGLRWSPNNGTAFNVWGTMGIQIHLTTGKKILLGTQDPGAAQKALESYKKQPYP